MGERDLATQPNVPRYRRWQLPLLVDRALSFAIVEGDSEETRRTKRLLTGALWVSLLTSGVSLYQLAVLDQPLTVLSLGASFLTTVGSLLAMWIRPSTYPGVMHYIAAINILVTASLTVMFGGFLQSGANAVWGVVAVLGAIAIFADGRAVVWLGFFVIVTVGSAVWADRIEPVYSLPNPEYFALFNLLVVVLFTFFLLFYYVKQRATLLEQSENLLRNILPDEIADRLKASDATIAEDFDSASILFADVSGFTPMSADMTPKELVALLDEVFTEFDGLVEERGLEKIKTIGDAYMVAAGVPVPRRDHAHAISDLALAMRDLVRARRFQGRDIRFRMGINSGPVIAGIIGRKKFSYDLWGDSVNTASRMESFGVAGRIQITDNTRRLVEDDFVCEPGGTRDVKGKGPMTVWFLEGRREPVD